MKSLFQRSPVFNTLTVSQRAVLADVSDLRRYKKSERIFAEGDPARWVWVIVRGMVSLTKATPSGGQASLCVLTPEESLCGFSAFEDGPGYSATAVAATDVQLIVIPAEAIVRLLDRVPAFSRAVRQLCCRRVRRMAEAVVLAQAPVPERIAATLLRLSRVHGPTVPVTHHELAALAGTRWETSIRTIAGLRHRGLVRTSRGRITILSSERLAAMLTTGNGTSPVSLNGAH